MVSIGILISTAIYISSFMKHVHVYACYNLFFMSANLISVEPILKYKFRRNTRGANKQQGQRRINQ